MPLEYERFIVVYRQATVWIRGYEPSPRDSLRLVVGEWSGILDGDPSTLPPDLELPEGVPRLTISSSDRQWSAEVAAGRLNVKWRASNWEEAIPPERFSATALGIIGPYLGLNVAIVVARMAYVQTRFATEAEPGAALADAFCKPALRQGPLNRPEDFELHAHKAYDPRGMPRVNSWIRWKAGTEAMSNQRVIAIEQDLNTLPSESAQYRTDDVASFFSRVTDEADEVVRQYLAAASAIGGNP